MRIFQHKYRLIFPGLLLFLMVQSCSTKKDAFLNRAYHNLTARDNGYFNARLKVEDGFRKLSDAHVDRYDRILSVFRYAEPDKGKAIAAQMDEAIKKSSVVITRHSMMINGIEKCRWIDDNYIIIGKANFIKRDYYPAIENFQYVAAQFKDEDTKYEALLWLMKVYLEQKNFSDAENIMDYLNGEPKVPQELKGELAATSASYYIQTKNFDSAISQLLKSVKLTKKRAPKTRYMFILAQLYQREGTFKKAFDLYSSVIKRNPAYEMAFNAKINRARCYDNTNAQGNAVKTELLKMLKDEKNKEFLDQVYYALGMIALQEKKEDEGVKDLNLSIRSSTLNAGQKALSYLELGNLNYKKALYRKAQAYYDSTVSFLAKDHPDYDDIMLKRNSLNKLVKYLKVIETEDSLQKVALMPPDQRDAFIDNLIKKLKEEDERKKKEEEEKKQLNAAFASNNFGANSTTTAGGAWYFYNPGSISFGYNDFVKRWGNRANEDNWRRSNKEQVIAQAAEEKDSSNTPGDTSKKAGKYDRQKYYKNLPIGPKQLEKSNLRIIDAYYNITLIYKEQIQDLQESAKAAEELLRRYPENQFKLPMYYNLYLVYTKLGNTSRANFYKDLLLDKYPDSEYAQVILDPDYFQNAENRNSKLNNYYKETYALFTKGDNEEVVKRGEESRKLFPGNKLIPKFDYLNTLVVGRTKGIDAYTASLKEIIKKYPGDEVKVKAEEVLALLADMKEHKFEPGKEKEKEKERGKPLEIYHFSPDTIHYFVMFFPQDQDQAKIRTRLEAYTKKSYGQSPFEFSVIQVDDKTKAMLVKQFNDKDGAQDYLYGLKEDKNIFADIQSLIDMAVISPENLGILLSTRDLNRYFLFFKLNYPDIAHF